VPPAPGRKMTPLGLAGAAFVFAYPAAVYFGLGHLGTRTLGLGLAALMVGGVMLRMSGKRREHAVAVARVPLTLALLPLLGGILDDRRYVLSLPVLANVILLAHFAASLRSVSFAERIARTQEEFLSPAQVAYCRAVTKSWCAFFVANGLISALLAAWAPVSWWTLYTGLISYALVGLLSAAEYVARKARFRRYAATTVDRLIARLFPPTVSAAARPEPR